ncbi:EKC/KEOPS complex subunit TP53RK-like [Macrosteles quadrilineatus]|uniref:EKC/KEOPS complex subunit TP53RK-like n=1 Tax=Macrosteles quadrilineatus TaxID=74068 RepID=UPI0023E1A768|nr:EKC/KEOPS complex subunit TP53RK-like [Macrosteles quadrilineatus]
MDLNANYMVIKQGAEGKIYKGLYLNKRVIVKERFVKHYRINDLDEHLTKERMKAEAKTIVKSKNAGVRTPAIYLVDFDHRILVMEEIVNSVTVKDAINELTSLQAEGDVRGKLETICQEIGLALGKLHKNGIVHGDLTTSNMLLKQNSPECEPELYLIDFGLSLLDASPQDKGVDLYVLERALISTHKNSEQLFDLILKAYQTVYKKGSCSEVMSKLEEVRARGRKRTMVG